MVCEQKLNGYTEFTHKKNDSSLWQHLFVAIEILGEFRITGTALRRAVKGHSNAADFSDQNHSVSTLPLITKKEVCVSCSQWLKQHTYSIYRPVYLHSMGKVGQPLQNRIALNWNSESYQTNSVTETQKDTLHITALAYAQCYKPRIFNLRV